MAGTDGIPPDELAEIQAYARADAANDPPLPDGVLASIEKLTGLRSSDVA